MNFIFICQRNPWRLDGGALIRNYWMVRALAREHRVHLVTVDDAQEPVPEDFARVCTSIARFPRSPGALGRARRVLEALRPATSYFTSGAVTSGMRHAVTQLAAHPETAAMCDLSVRDALDRASIPYVYNAHNTEYELLGRRAAREREPLRTLLKFESARTRRVERDFLHGALLTAACSLDDGEELARLDPSVRGRILIVPNGVDLARYAPVAANIPSSRTILISGSYDWQPNILGLKWFVDEVLSELRSKCLPHALDVRVAGRMSDALAKSLDALEGVTAVARPADMRVELERARIVLAPIVASSGTRLRILEAWAAGRPVVTTPSGAFGLRYVDGDDLLVGSSGKELAASAALLLDDDGRWMRVRANALTRAKEYDWEAIGERFVAAARPALNAIVKA